MIVYAAIDLRGGQAVQLVGGRTDAQAIALPDPVEVALRWIALGFKALHVVDLDAALNDPRDPRAVATAENRAIIAEILDVATVPVQVGGGVRDDDAVDTLIEAGAARVIAGTRAVEDPEWLARMTRKYPGQLVVAADVRAGYVTVRGWSAQTEVTAEALLADLRDEPVGGVLITDVGREGQMVGVDVALFTKLVQASAHPVIAAGGIRDLSDLHALERAGVAGAVLGMSLYTGSIDAVAAATDFG